MQNWDWQETRFGHFQVVETDKVGVDEFVFAERREVSFRICQGSELGKIEDIFARDRSADFKIVAEESERCGWSGYLDLHVLI